jgi:hypothetical protein
MTNAKVARAVRRQAVLALTRGELPSGGPPGVKPVAVWREGRYGSVLFLAEPTAGLFSFSYPALHHENLRLSWMRRWVGAGSGGVGLHSPLDGPPGLVRLGGSTSRHLRITVGFATAEVSSIRLSNASRMWKSPVGIDGFFLLGVAHDQPITRAVAVNANGDELTDTALVL